METSSSTLGMGACDNSPATERLNEMSEFPLLETERLVLREISVAHAQDLLALLSDPEVARFRVDGFDTSDQAIRLAGRLHDAFYEGTGVCWGMALKREEQIIGTCSLSWSPANASAHLGYDLSPASWGNGYMREAVRAVLHYAIEDVGLNRVQATVRIDNERSAALLRSVGFVEEGVLREFAVTNGEAYDMRCFSVLKREWPPPLPA